MVDNNLRRRLTTGALIVTLASLVTFYFPNWVFALLASYMIGVALSEFFGMVDHLHGHVWDCDCWLDFAGSLVKKQSFGIDTEEGLRNKVPGFGLKVHHPVGDGGNGNECLRLIDESVYDCGESHVEASLYC